MFFPLFAGSVENHHNTSKYSMFSNEPVRLLQIAVLCHAECALLEKKVPGSFLQTAWEVAYSLRPPDVEKQHTSVIQLMGS